MEQSSEKKELNKKDAKQNRQTEKKSIKREIFEWIMVFVVAAAMAFVVRTLSLSLCAWMVRPCSIRWWTANT